MTTNDTTKSMLHAFTLPKPIDPKAPEKTTSAPNHAKVDPISTSLMLSVMGANCGMGSLLSVGLEYLRKVTLAILSQVPAEKFTVAQDTIINQLAILGNEVKGLSKAGADAEFNAMMEGIKAKMAAPKGAITEAGEPGVVPASGGVSLAPQQAISIASLPTDKKELEDVLTKMLTDLKTDGNKAN